VKIGSVVRPGRRIKKDCQKSQSGNISPIWGEAHTVPIETKICMAGNFTDIIAHAKFQGDIFKGYDFTGGANFRFSYSFLYGSTVQCNCAACDMPYWVQHIR